MIGRLGTGEQYGGNMFRTQDIQSRPQRGGMFGQRLREPGKLAKRLSARWSSYLRVRLSDVCFGKNQEGQSDQSGMN